MFWPLRCTTSWIWIGFGWESGEISLCVRGSFGSGLISLLRRGLKALRLKCLELGRLLLTSILNIFLCFSSISLCNSLNLVSLLSNEINLLKFDPSLPILISCGYLCTSKSLLPWFEIFLKDLGVKQTEDTDYVSWTNILFYLIYLSYLI